MTVRELKEHSGQCIELDAAFVSKKGHVFKLKLWRGDVWMMQQRETGMWESVREASALDVVALSKMERQIA